MLKLSRYTLFKAIWSTVLGSDPARLVTENLPMVAWATLATEPSFKRTISLTRTPIGRSSEGSIVNSKGLKEGRVASPKFLSRTRILRGSEASTIVRVPPPVSTRTSPGSKLEVSWL